MVMAYHEGFRICPVIEIDRNNLVIAKGEPELRSKGFVTNAVSRRQSEIKLSTVPSCQVHEDGLILIGEAPKKLSPDFCS